MLVVVGLTRVLTAQSSDPVDPAGILDAITNNYHTASQLWLSRLTSVTQRTFVTLAGVEFAISGLLWGMRRDGLDEIAARFLLKFVLISFLLLLITGFGTWVTPIIDGFAVAGERAVGGTTVSPSRVIDLGMALGDHVAHAFDRWGVVTHFMMAIVSGFAVLIILVAFIIIATQLMLTLVESYIVLGGGVLFLAFAAFRATAAYSENFLNYAVSVGIKIFLLYLIVGVGTSVTTSVVQVMQAEPAFSADLRPLGQVLGLAIIFAVMAVRIPNHVAAKITASHSFGVATALRSL